MNDLYNAINGLCEVYNTSISKMCKDLGLYRSMFSDLKSGRKQKISTETLKLVADYFGVSVDFLLGKTENSPENRTVEMLQSLRDADRALLEVARDMDENSVYAAAEFIRKLKGGSADAD